MDPNATRPEKTSPDEEPPRLTYQVILRHLAKFRDGARAVLEHIDIDGNEPEHPGGPGAVAAPAADQAEPDPEANVEAEKTPLQRRIDRHMGAVDRALVQIRDLNPDHKKWGELTEEVRNLVARKERAIRDIVGSELHFWSATIEGSPLERLDDVEAAWVYRMLRLAKLVGVDEDHQDHLKFIQEWASYEHH